MPITPHIPPDERGYEFSRGLPEEAVHANARWWSANAREYLAEHGTILGDTDFLWCPEGVREADIHFLGDLRGKRVLEIGAGAAQCSRYLAMQDVDITASDIAEGMLRAARDLNRRYKVSFPLDLADARALPYADSSFDVVFTSFGALPFVADLASVHREVHRVLRPSGVWAYSAMHPMRWMFPDDPTWNGMHVVLPYFDTDPYLEKTGKTLEYAEFHHTFTDHINSLVNTGFVIDKVLEPRWPEGREVVWGGWGPERSSYIPGTLMIRALRR
ncbi:MAG: class I SAM-dependent methyltransferase [Actinomycetaceae bacterium]|nr:class I SAM-dependent methyltransferase [Actinomycetaceae bacterium]